MHTKNFASTIVIWDKQSQQYVYHTQYTALYSLATELGRLLLITQSAKHGEERNSQISVHHPYSCTPPEVNHVAIS